MKLNKKYSIAWVIWILFFVVVEALAIIDKKKGDTLSEHFWKKFGIVDAEKKRNKKGLRLVGAAFLMWLVIHLLTGGWM